MAKDIKLVTSEYRPCWVQGKRAVFHRWTDSARPVKARGMEQEENAERYQLHSVHGLVEFEDGSMERVWPSAIQFATLPECWPSEEEWTAMEEADMPMPWKIDEGNEAEPLQENRAVRKDCNTCRRNPVVCDPTPGCKGKCKIDGCVCRWCEDYSKWEPAEGKA